MRRLVGAAGVALLAACTAAEPRPAPIDTKNDACGFCRMAVSDVRYAAQLVAPNEDPRFFDDVGCFAAFVMTNRNALPKGALGFVADHRTKAFVRAASAVYVRVDALATPMGSHLVAHANEASRSADLEASQGVPRTLADVFGPLGAPDGR